MPQTSSSAQTVTALPATGLPKEQIEAELEAVQATGVDWRNGRLPIFVYHVDDELQAFSLRAFGRFFSENAHAHSAFPGLARLEQEVVAMGQQLLRGGPQACGSMTSGGTESIFLAVLGARERARIRQPNIQRPRIVLPRTAHPAFDKAAFYLGMQVTRVAVDQSFRANVDAMAHALTDDVVMLVGSAPAFPHGVMDPIEAIAGLAHAQGLWMHVDACVGGYLAPFARELGYPVPRFELDVPGVTSLSADLHKYGFAAKPASTLFYADRADAAHQSFVFDQWPRGRYVSETFVSTRPAGAAASAWAVMRHLGHSGYLEIARVTMQTRDRLIAGVQSIAGLAVCGSPEIGVVTYCSKDPALSIELIARGLTARGWFVARNAEPPGIQFVCMPVHAPAMQAYLDDLRAVAEATRGQVAPPSQPVEY